MFCKINLDPCSNPDSLIIADIKYILPTNGLLESWDYEKIYVNPPYGRNNEDKTSIKDWIKKCYESNYVYNSEVLALIPVATNTSHWKDYIWNKAKGICFLYDTRLKFYINGSIDNKGAPMACCVIYWGKNYKKFKRIFSKFGKVIEL